MRGLANRALWLGVLAFLGGCAGFRHEEVAPPDVELVNLVLQDATLFEQKLRIDLRIINPNDFDLPLDGLVFDLRVNGDRVARGTSSDSVTIPRLGDDVVHVETHTSSVAILRQMLNPPPGGVYQYQLEGTVFLKGFGRRQVRFERKGELPGPGAPPGKPSI